MTIPYFERLEGDITDFPIYNEQTPYAPNWFLYSTITRIPETSVGWLTAQGWQILNSYVEEDCGQTFYNMYRQGMNHMLILQNLLTGYVNAYNKGREYNDTRYDDVVAYWVDAINRCGNHVEQMGDISDGHLGTPSQVGTYLGDMSALVTEVKAEIDNTNIDRASAVGALETQLANYLTALDSLQSIYDPHELDAESLLDGLGVAERARINEQFDSTLAKALQQLTDRGMYSSYLVTSVTARVERERSEALTNLADRLNREKLDNEHKLYEQEINLNALVLDGRVKHNDALLRKAQFATEMRKNLALALMQARMEAVMARLNVRDREEKLMAYQLDTHNNLAIGLWNFIERRDDEYPSMESITKLVAGLGDAGGGWVTP